MPIGPIENKLGDMFFGTANWFSQAHPVFQLAHRANLEIGFLPQWPPPLFDGRDRLQRRE